MQNPMRRLEVRDRERQPREHRVARAARDFLRIPLLGVEEVAIYLLKNTQSSLNDEHLKSWAQEVFCDPILQEFSLSNWALTETMPGFVVEIFYLPGVTDNIGRSAAEAISLIAAANTVSVYSGSAFYLYGDISRADAERVATELLGNTLIQAIKVYSRKEYEAFERFEVKSVPEVKLVEDQTVATYSLDLPDDQLKALSKNQCWALTLEEINTIRAYFASAEFIKLREKNSLPANPTDVEMEVLAQTWSEHCKHKIFAAGIQYDEEISSGLAAPKLGSFKVNSIFKEFIRGATEKVRKERGIDWLVSVFSDNAGIVRFDPKLDLCIKVETHNSPSALDPYGGALTGIVGVNRDILGCGMGARPIANTDVFCFASPEWPNPEQEKELPNQLKHPRRIFSGVHLGVEDGGNKSGIPTVNGAIYFDQDYAGKPLVFCGTVGALPAKLPSGSESHTKGQKPGDFIVMAGGRIGKDGIHGATFSSMELNDGAPATVVQIGDPITQKRLADFLLEARDAELFSSVTDNGAGGLSSSVGEMAGLTNGAEIDLSKAPLKYPGLKPFEIFVSESQERMTFSVHPGKIGEFLELAKRRNVEASVLGTFTDSGNLLIKYGSKTVALLPMEFLHDGLPQMQLVAMYSDQNLKTQPWVRFPELQEVNTHEYSARSFLEGALFKLLSSWNIRSKESWVRRYDHEVQAATVGKPFVGKKADGPGDAGILSLEVHGGSAGKGVAIACGMAPRLSRWDAYTMAQYSLDEAVRNCVAVGANPDRLALVDNFCWPDPLPGEKNPDAHQKLAQLVRASRGLYDLAVAYGAPFVSGKDSMKNDFIGKTRFGKELKISVPPTVLVTAMAEVPDIKRMMSSDFKQANNLVYVLGPKSRMILGSEIQQIYNFSEKDFSHELFNLSPLKQLELYRKVFSANQQGLLQSCHDCSEGGLLVAVAESCIGGGLGFELELSQCQWQDCGALWEFLYNETPGRFVISIKPQDEQKFLQNFNGIPLIKIGKTTDSDVLRVTREGLVLVDAQIEKMKRLWKGGEQ